jgi:hypothetical protein
LLYAIVPLVWAGRQEDVTHSVSTGFGQCKSTFLLQEIMGYVYQDPGPVPGFPICTDSPSVFQFFKDIQCLVNNVIGSNPLEAANKSSSAIFVLELR